MELIGSLKGVYVAPKFVYKILDTYTFLWRVDLQDLYDPKD